MSCMFSLHDGAAKARDAPPGPPAFSFWGLSVALLSCGWSKFARSRMSWPLRRLMVVRATQVKEDLRVTPASRPGGRNATCCCCYTRNKQSARILEDFRIPPLRRVAAGGRGLGLTKCRLCECSRPHSHQQSSAVILLGDCKPMNWLLVVVFLGFGGGGGGGWRLTEQSIKSTNFSTGKRRQTSA